MAHSAAALEVPDDSPCDLSVVTHPGQQTCMDFPGTSDPELRISRSRVQNPQHFGGQYPCTAIDPDFPSIPFSPNRRRASCEKYHAPQSLNVSQPGSVPLPYSFNLRLNAGSIRMTPKRMGQLRMICHEPEQESTTHFGVVYSCSCSNSGSSAADSTNSMPITRSSFFTLINRTP